MQIILLDKISNLGRLGEQVNVKAGYARNYLIPQGKAVPSTKENIEYFRTVRAEFEAKMLKIKAAAEERAAKISELGSITISSRSGTEGKLFGSIGTRDIANAITAAGIKVTKNEVRLRNGVLRTTGEYNIKIQVHSEIFANLKIVIVPKI